MIEVSWIGSVLRAFAWMIPVFLLLRLTFPLLPRFRGRSGAWQLLAGGSVMFFSLLFSGWWFIRVGRLLDGRVLAAHLVLLLSVLLVLYGGHRILVGFREYEPVLAAKLGRQASRVLGIIGALLFILFTFSFVVKPRPWYQFFDETFLDLSFGLLLCLYILFGSIIKLIHPGSKRHFLAYVASVPILLDAFLRTHVFLVGTSPDMTAEARLVSSVGMILSAFLLYVSVNPSTKELVARMGDAMPLTLFEHRKVETQRRFAFTFSFMILFLGVAGALMLESIRSDEEIIEATYLVQQQKVAKSVTVNLSSVATDLVHDLERLSRLPAVRKMDVQEMQKIFSKSLVKWDTIVNAFTRLDSTGVIRYTCPEVPGVIGRDISYQAHVKLFMRTRDIVMSGPFMAVQGFPAIALYVPVFSSVRRGDEVFDGGMAMLVRISSFSDQAFRNVSILNSNPIAAIGMDGIVFSESAGSHVGETASKYLSAVFGGKPGEERLRNVAQGVLRATSPTIISVDSAAPPRLGSEWIVAVPIEVVGKRLGVMIVPIRSSEIVSLYQQGMSHQVRLWAVLLVALLGMTGIILIMYGRWSAFLEAEVKRERDLVRETEGRYTDLVNDAVVGIFEAKGSGEFITVNPALARLLGHSSPDELIGKKIMDEKDLREHSESHLTEKNSGEYIRLDRTDGTPIFVRLSCRAEENAGGDVVRYEGFVEDVTEQYLAHLRLEDSEKRYSTLFKLSPAGIYVSTVEGKVLEANDSFAKIFGFESGEEVCRLSATAFYVDSHSRSEFLDKLEKRRSLTHEISIGKRKDGSEIYILENSELKYDPSYKREVIRGACMDVTEIVLLQQQVELNRRAAEALSEVLVAAFEGGELTGVINDSLSSVGKKLELRGAFIVRSEEGSTKSEYCWWSDTSVSQALKGIDCASFELLFRDGSVVYTSGMQKENGLDIRKASAVAGFGPWSYAISPVRLSNEPTREEKIWGYLVLLDSEYREGWNPLEKDLLSSMSRILSTVIERHEETKIRRNLEEERKRLFLTFEQLAESVLVSDVDGIIQYVNSTFTKITGYTREEAIGRRTNILKSGAHDAEFYKKLWETISSGNVFKARFTNKRKDGTTYYEDKTIAPVIDSDGKVVSFVEVGYDVTEQISLEEQLAQSQKLESIGMLAGGIAHDFNNILGAILGYASFMKNKIPEDHQFYKYVDTIERSATRAAELTSQLLAFARRGKYNVTPVSINRMVLDTLRIIQSTIDKSIVVSVNLSDDLPAVEADPGQMQQVVMNLCVNARDAMPGGGFLTIETSQVELAEKDTRVNIEAHPGRYVLLSVSDTGIGMDKQTLRRIFEPFFTTKEKNKGTGLGLSMVYGIVRNHGGFINVESEPGKGTAFRIFYPASGKEEGGDKSVIVQAEGGSGTILVAEDEEAMRELIRDILESGGYEVIETEDGEAAVQVYAERKNEIDLVILDMIMPRKNGSETFRELKEIDPEVSVLLSSGYSQDEKAQELLNEGVAGFLGKPYQVGELLRKVRMVLKGKKEI